MTERVVVLDTETTKLGYDRRIWEAAAIEHEPGKAPVEHHWFVWSIDLDLANADPMSLRIGGFYDRHPEYGPEGNAFDDAVAEPVMLHAIERVTRGAHILGAVPNFDTEVLAVRMRAAGMLWSGHYHLIDIETAAYGYLKGQGKPAPPLPWDSDILMGELGVEPPGPGERHTALGDARWALRAWERICGVP